jgi:copper chaperone
VFLQGHGCVSTSIQELIMNTIHLEVQGMSCGGCVKRVKEALEPLNGVGGVEVDLASGHVSVTGDFPQGGDPLVLALTAAGYPAKFATPTVPRTSAGKPGGCCG